MGCFGTSELYVVLPYFNFCQFKRREQLFIEFLDHMAKFPVKVVIVSAGGLPYSLNCFKHIEVQYKHTLWVKENLINIAIRRLPKSWKYVAWVDADITFLNQNWVKDTIEELQVHDVVQLFQTAVNLGPSQEALKIDKSFGYMFKKSGTPLCRTDKYGFWHPGYAWACTKNAYKQMGGLIDWAILGSGDRHMAMALANRVEWSAPGTIHQNYRGLLERFQFQCRKLRLGYITGTILHHWHGSLENRRYRERWDILTAGEYEPTSDVDYTKDGMIYFTRKGERLEPDIDSYFLARREDD